MIQFNIQFQKITQEYSSLCFVLGQSFVWSSSTNTITYKNISTEQDLWALIHEVAHAVLGHKNYASDYQLIMMEMEAWAEAKKLARKYGTKIDEDHIQNCLDTYRDWLHNRSTCPTCQVVGGQADDQSYKCFNCHTSWRVPDNPVKKIKKTPLIKIK